MLYGIFHQGSGLGNQLHRYVAARMIAKALKDDFGMVAPELFKGHSFMKLGMGKPCRDYEIEYPAGKVIPNVEGRVLDGEFQNEIVFKGGLPLIRKWLKVEPLEMPDDLCVINFRGGEYALFPELFLPKEYWEKAIGIMRDRHPGIRFEVHTDDEELARKFFPDFDVLHDIGINWRSIRYAKHLILANSSFAILPAYLNEDVEDIFAPKYWARYNTKEWIEPDNATYSKFEYIHHED